jgi:hypothetical protein
VGEERQENQPGPYHPAVAPPALPADAPPALVEFVNGERDEVTLASGRLSWLPTPSAVRLVMRAPETTFSKERPGHVAIRVKWGPASARLVARVDDDGDLVMDTSDVPSFLGLRGPIENWAASLNAHFRATGRRLEPAELRGSALTLRAAPR